MLKEAEQVIELCNNPARKEIKGLSERLFGLDQLLHEAKKCAVEQKESAQVYRCIYHGKNLL